jgi:hypothetical protein
MMIKLRAMTMALMKNIAFCLGFLSGSLTSFLRGGIQKKSVADFRDAPAGIRGFEERQGGERYLRNHAPSL